MGECQILWRKCELREKWVFCGGTGCDRTTRGLKRRVWTGGGGRVSGVGCLSFSLSLFIGLYHSSFSLSSLFLLLCVSSISVVFLALGYCHENTENVCACAPHDVCVRCVAMIHSPLKHDLRLTCQIVTEVLLSELQVWVEHTKHTFSTRP